MKINTKIESKINLCIKIIPWLQRCWIFDYKLVDNKGFLLQMKSLEKEGHYNKVLKRIFWEHSS